MRHVISDLSAIAVREQRCKAAHAGAERPTALDIQVAQVTVTLMGTEEISSLSPKGSNQAA
jgi:hypothetical protein